MSSVEKYKELIKYVQKKFKDEEIRREKFEAIEYLLEQEKGEKALRGEETGRAGTGKKKRANSSARTSQDSTWQKKEENGIVAMLESTAPWLNVHQAMATLKDAPDDGRPFLKVKFGDNEIESLLDTGASVSVMASETFIQLFGTQILPPEVDRNHKVTGITGNIMGVRDFVELDMEVLGRKMRRPFLIVDGLHHHQCVLGYDFVKEEQVVIDGATNQASYRKEPELEGQWPVAALRTVKRTTILPRSIQHIQVQAVREGKPLPAGEVGVVAGMHTDGLTVWDCLQQTNERGMLWLAVINMSKRKICIRGEERIARFSNPEMQAWQLRPLDEITIASLFGSMKPDKADPPRGEIRELSEEDWQELKGKLHIAAVPEKRQAYESLLRKYHDVCSKDKFDLGFSDVVEHKIVMRNNEPVHSRQFRVPFAHEKVLHSYIEELLRQGAIEVSRSPYNSPIFCVTKKLPPDAPPGTPPPLRCVLDFRKVNAASLPDRYSIKEVRECIDEVGRLGSDIFTTIDLTAGFWQQRLEESSRPYTAFSVPGKGARYQWKVTPMGLQGSPASFSRLMDFVMRDLPGVLTYVDDVLSHCKGHDDHLKKVEDALWRLRKYGLKLNVTKTTFAAEEVQYLGYTISGKGVSPSKDKLRAVSELKPPRDVRAVREFIGMANYFRFLIPHFATKVAPLTALTTKASEWKEGTLPTEAGKAFQDLRNYLISAPIVQFPKREGEFILHTDACSGEGLKGEIRPGGFGAVLTQEQEGKERVIAYASRALRDHEKNYSAFLLEMAAAVFGIEHFDTYLVGRRFVLRMDHRPLEKMSTIHQKTLNRLQQLMLEYDFRLEYQKGEDNVVSDFLSRNIPELQAVVGSIESIGVDIGQLQKEDPEIQQIIGIMNQDRMTRSRTTTQGQKKLLQAASECEIQEGLVWHVTQKPGRRQYALVAPAELRRVILRAGHFDRDAGHGGIDRTLERIKMDYWWPAMKQDVVDLVGHCEVCQRTKSRDPKPSPMKSLPVPQRPNERVHIDLFGPLKTSGAGNKHIMVMTDAFTKYAELTAILDKTAETVARAFLERWLCRFSAPVMLVTDQGKEFCNNVLKTVCELWDIDKARTSPFHPQTNSSAESYNRSIIKYMRAVIKDNNTLDWEELLPALTLAYNCHVHRSTGETPFFLTFLHDPRLPVFDIEKPRQFYKHGYVEDSYMTMQKAFHRAQISMTEAARRSKTYYDRKAEERTFKAGEKILVHFPNVPPGQNQKFYTKWKPYEVVKMVGKLNIQCQDSNKKSKPIIVHVDRAVKFKKRDYISMVSISNNSVEDELGPGGLLAKHREEDEARWEDEEEVERGNSVDGPPSTRTDLEHSGDDEEGEDGNGFEYEDPWLRLGRYIWGSNNGQTRSAARTAEEARQKAGRARLHQQNRAGMDSGRGEEVSRQDQAQDGRGAANKPVRVRGGSKGAHKPPQTRARGPVEDIPLPSKCWTRIKPHQE